MLRDRHGEVLDRWYQLYTIHFGEAATLSRHEFLSCQEETSVSAGSLSFADAERDLIARACFDRR